MEFGKVVLIILTILIVGPIVFIGSCFPATLIGTFTINPIPIVSTIFGLVLIPTCVALAIFVCYKIIKKIVSPKKDVAKSN